MGRIWDVEYGRAEYGALYVLMNSQYNNRHANKQL